MKPHGVRVSVVCPPDVDTPGFAQENRKAGGVRRDIAQGTGHATDDVACRTRRRAQEPFLHPFPAGAGVLFRLKGMVLVWCAWCSTRASEVPGES